MAETQRIPEPLPDTSASYGYVFGPFRMDVTTYQLFRDNVEVDLTSKVFDTLLMLVRQRHRVVSKDEMLAAIWRDAVVTDDSLIQCISSLRRTLGDDATKPTYIATVSRRGYRFIAPVTEWTEPHESSATAAGPATVPAIHRDTPSEPAVTPGSASRERHLSPAVLAATALVMLFAGWLIGRVWNGQAASSAPAGVLRFSQTAPPGTTLASGGALSPNGAYIAFAAEDNSGLARLWVRALDSAQARVLDGTDGATRPFWSPDSSLIGFFANGKLKTVRMTGGAPTELATVGPRPAGAAWSRGGQIIFSTWLSGFSAVSASGGAIIKVTDLGEGEITHAWPQFLPDGEHFIYSVFATGDLDPIKVGRLGSTETIKLLDADVGAVYSPSGYLVFPRGGILTAQRFDPESLTLLGEPFSIASGNVVSPNMTNGTILSAAAGGLIAFGGATGESELAWFDRTGRRLSTVAATVALHNPELSADGRQVYANTYPPAQTGVWGADLDRDATSRLVPDGSVPMPSPDGQRIAFTSGREPGSVGIFTTAVGAAAGTADVRVLTTPERKNITDWTRDGRFIVYQVTGKDTSQDLWMVPVTPGSGEPQPLLQTPANEIQGRVSPDGRWLAYASDESGTWEVYVRSFPDGKVKHLISPSGGAEPQWRADGRELFYLGGNNAIMAVSLTSGSTLVAGRPVALFRPEIIGEPATYRNHYAVTPDGSRFLVDVLQAPSQDPINLVINWAR